MHQNGTKDLTERRVEKHAKKGSKKGSKTRKTRKTGKIGVFWVVWIWGVQIWVVQIWVVQIWWTGSRIRWSGSGGSCGWGLTRPLLILTRARGREKTMRTTPCVQKVSENTPPPDMAKTPPQAQNHVQFCVDFGRARNMQKQKTHTQKTKNNKKYTVQKHDRKVVTPDGVQKWVLGG